jgi:hypothetical protein
MYLRGSESPNAFPALTAATNDNLLFRCFDVAALAVWVKDNRTGLHKEASKFGDDAALAAVQRILQGRGSCLFSACGRRREETPPETVGTLGRPWPRPCARRRRSCHRPTKTDGGNLVAIGVALPVGLTAHDCA